jgi:hypothetical protein
VKYRDSQHPEEAEAVRDVAERTGVGWVDAETTFEGRRAQRGRLFSRLRHHGVPKPVMRLLKTEDGPVLLLANNPASMEGFLAGWREAYPVLRRALNRHRQAV